MHMACQRSCELLLISCFLFFVLNLVVVSSGELNNALTPSSISHLFPRFKQCGNRGAIPAYTVSNNSYTSVHRFFDSSPFSPSGRYIATTRFPIDYAAKNAASKILAEVVVIDLRSNSPSNLEILVDKTEAWGSQVGAHVQWGGRDDQLFYNVLGSRGEVVGVVYNIFSKEKRLLECPVYHVSSNGAFVVSPNMSKIQNTQLGYGVDGIASKGSNINAPLDDGLFVTESRTGKCKLLISLKELCELAELDVESTPTYGFHAKWSSDDKHLLFVVRTLNKEKIEAEFNPIKRLWSYVQNPKRIRNQHLFVLSSDGKNAKHVVSWASKPSDVFKGTTSSKRCFANDKSSLLDGNHPNWIPNTHMASMNMKRNSMDQTWSIAIFDLFASNNSSIQLLRGLNPAPEEKCVTGISRKFVPNVLGSGHPNFKTVAAKGGSHVFITDAYSKEKKFFANKSSGCVPIRLVDIDSNSDIWLLQAQVDRSTSDRLKKHPSHVERGAWRCDPHPAWSRNYQWVAFNSYVHFEGRESAPERQVVVAYVGDLVAQNV